MGKEQVSQQWGRYREVIDAPTREPMRPSGIRNNPSTDQKKVRRAMGRGVKRMSSSTGACPTCGETQTDALAHHASCISLNPLSAGKALASQGENMNRTSREAQLLQAMAVATPGEQQRLAADLERLREDRITARVASRGLDLYGTQINARMAPVPVHQRSTAETDWLHKASSGISGDPSQQMRTEASLWFTKTSKEVIEDEDEFTAQASGVARRTAGKYGQNMERAQRAFMDQANHLRRAAGYSSKTASGGDFEGESAEFKRGYDDAVAGKAEDGNSEDYIDGYAEGNADYWSGGFEAARRVANSPIDPANPEAEVDVEQSGNAESTVTDYEDSDTDPAFEGEFTARRKTSGWVSNGKGDGWNDMAYLSYNEDYANGFVANVWQSTIDGRWHTEVESQAGRYDGTEFDGITYATEAEAKAAVEGLMPHHAYASKGSRKRAFNEFTDSTEWIDNGPASSRRQLGSRVLHVNKSTMSDDVYWSVQNLMGHSLDGGDIPSSGNLASDMQAGRAAADAAYSGLSSKGSRKTASSWTPLDENHATERDNGDGTLLMVWESFNDGGWKWSKNNADDLKLLYSGSAETYYTEAEAKASAEAKFPLVTGSRKTADNSNRIKMVEQNIESFKRKLPSAYNKDEIRRSIKANEDLLKKLKAEGSRKTASLEICHECALIGNGFDAYELGLDESYVNDIANKIGFGTPDKVGDNESFTCDTCGQSTLGVMYRTASKGKNPEDGVDFNPEKGVDFNPEKGVDFDKEKGTDFDKEKGLDTKSSRAVANFAARVQAGLAKSATVNTWADGYGLWYAAVPISDPEGEKAQAYKAIRDALNQRGDISEYRIKVEKVRVEGDKAIYRETDA